MLYVERVTHPTQLRLSAYHFAKTYAAIHGEMIRLIMSDAEFQEIELRDIWRELVLVPLVVPEQVIPDVVVPEPQLVVDIPEAEDVIKPAILALVVVLRMDDKDIEEDPEMDPEEPDQIDEG